jgi:hypothetical protein
MGDSLCFIKADRSPRTLAAAERVPFVGFVELLGEGGGVGAVDLDEDTDEAGAAFEEDELEEDSEDDFEGVEDETGVDEAVDDEAVDDEGLDDE